MEQKVGRNDPCYCGSGLKYKKCHMKADKEKERSRIAHAMAVKYLRQDMLKFAREAEYEEAFAAGLTHYWNGLYDIDNAAEMGESEALRFFDWFLFDYSYEGKPRLIETYQAVKGESLSEAQNELLAAWLEAEPAGGYELTGYDGQTLHLKDYLTGETVDVFATNGRGNVDVGEVILARVLPMRDHKQFSTTAAYLPAAEITDVKEKFAAAKEKFLADNPDASHEQFMRANNIIYIHHALAEAERVGRPPVERLDPERDDEALRRATRMLAQRMGRRRRR